MQLPPHLLAALENFAVHLAEGHFACHAGKRGEERTGKKRNQAKWEGVGKKHEFAEACNSGDKLLML